MRAGRMRERVAFQRLDTTPDALGNVTSGAYSTILTVWCERMVPRMRETFTEGRREASADLVVKIRYSSASAAITTADRAVIDGETHQIIGIDNYQSKNHELHVSLERGVGT